jgi:hypothetical protein
MCPLCKHKNQNKHQYKHDKEGGNAMEEIRYIEHKETKLGGNGNSLVYIRTGDKFCWTRLDYLKQETAAAARRLIEEIGVGPFVLEEIFEIPSGSILFRFTDVNGKKHEISKQYFATFS